VKDSRSTETVKNEAGSDWRFSREGTTSIFVGQTVVSQRFPHIYAGGPGGDGLRASWSQSDTPHSQDGSSSTAPRGHNRLGYVDNMAAGTGEEPILLAETILRRIRAVFVKLDESRSNTKRAGISCTLGSRVRCLLHSAFGSTLAGSAFGEQVVEGISPEHCCTEMDSR
jgi:hypothetical protein